MEGRVAGLPLLFSLVIFGHILLELICGCYQNGLSMVRQLVTGSDIPQVGGVTISRHPSFVQLVAFD
jgi:hypothetical protein